jgi:hypothetical protein
MNIDVLPHNVSIGEPIRIPGHSVFPLFRMVEGPAFRTLAQAQALQQVDIDESHQDEVAWFRQLEIGNLGSVPVLVLDGDLFQGGRQDRVADRPLWIPGHSRAPVSVTCIEQNRAERQGDGRFRVAGVAPPELRRRRMVDAPDQDATWSWVATARAGLGDPSGSLIEARPPDSERLAAQVRVPLDACGLVVAHGTAAGPRIALLEWFADPAAFAGVRDGVVRSAMDPALCERRPPRISRTEVRRFVARLAQALTNVMDESIARVGRIDSHGLRGWVTEIEGRLAHVVAVPG